MLGLSFIYLCDLPVESVFRSAEGVGGMAQLRPVVNSMESMSISNGATVETKPRKAEYLPMPADRATRTPHSG